MKKGFKNVALAVALMGGITFLPNSVGAETLGWSEETGYTTDFSVTARASSKPESHKATITIVGKPAENTEKVSATTKWKDVKHYSRARYEAIIGSTIKGDSGRKVGTGSTTATSGVVSKPGMMAKTYWGKA